MMSTLSCTLKSRQNVLGYPVDTVDLTRATEVIEQAWADGKPMHVVTLNAEMVITAQKNCELDRIIRRAHLIVPDGAGVVWALALAGNKVQRLPGIDLAWQAVASAAKTKRKVALIGGKQELLAQVQKNLETAHPGLQIVACQDGYFGSDQEAEIVDAISEKEPDLILVALGVPKQEYFIDRFAASHFAKSVSIGVGGSFDVWSGVKKRAPIIWQKLNLEWLYRLLCEPWRAQRMASSLPNFALQVLWHQLLGKNKMACNNTDDASSETSGQK
jgi:N-acetylglucosaminyldiphosphoundecaprenol N-acetyl-beta-D-mannosaminyltransferase